MNASSEKDRRNEITGARDATCFLFKLSLVLNGAVGAVLAVPVLGYLLGPAIKKGSSYNSWISLGRVRRVS